MGFTFTRIDFQNVKIHERYISVLVTPLIQGNYKHRFKDVGKKKQRKNPAIFYEIHAK